MYKSLQGTRAVAAIFVVLFHLGLTISLKKYFDIEEFSIPFLFGSAGVEYFFVLSGFIIYSAHYKDISQPDKIAIYIKKRFVRIYPAYWIVFISVLILAFLTGQDTSSSRYDPLVLIKGFFLVPQEKTWSGGTGSPVIDVAWTLQYEVFFYIFFCALILNRWIFIFISIFLCYIGFSEILIEYPSAFLKLIAGKWFLLFFMGMAVSFLCKNLKLSIFSYTFFLCSGLLVFFLLSLDTVIKDKFIPFEKLMPYGVASALIIFGLVGLEKSGQVLLDGKWMQRLGDSSYALYLIHYPVISVLCKIAIALKVDKLNVYGALMTYLVIFMACIFLSMMFHVFVEKPIGLFFKKFV